MINLFSLKAGDCFRPRTRPRLFIVLEEGPSHYIVQDAYGEIRKMRNGAVMRATQEEFLEIEKLHGE